MSMKYISDNTLIKNVIVSLNAKLLSTCVDHMSSSVSSVFSCYCLAVDFTNPKVMHLIYLWIPLFARVWNPPRGKAGPEIRVWCDVAHLGPSWASRPRHWFSLHLGSHYCSFSLIYQLNSRLLLSVYIEQGIVTFISPNFISAGQRRRTLPVIPLMSTRIPLSSFYTKPK